MEKYSCKYCNQFYEKKGLAGSNNAKQGEKLFSGLLKTAKVQRQRINRFKLEDAGLSKDRWLAVVVVDAETRVCLKIAKRNGKIDFVLDSADRKNEWGLSNNKNKRLTGNNTVPFKGAIPKFLSEANLVCVTPDDFGYFELIDKTLTKLAEFHGILPNMNMVHRLVVRFIKNAKDPYGNT